jgi:hypothetical protein
MNTELKALRKVNFNWTRSLESIWSATDITTGPNNALADEIVTELIHATQPGIDKLAGRVLVGQAGIGKTHLIGDLRRKMWDAGGWFVLLDVIGITDFWKSAALSFLTSLLQEMPDKRRQYEAVLAGVARHLKVEKQVEAAFAIPKIDAKRIVDLLIPGLMRIDPSKALKHHHVFRALSLLRSHDLAAVGIAHSWLQGYEADEEARKALGLLTPPPAPVDLVRGMSWVMSIAGPTMIAVDQIDGVINSGSVTIRGEEFSEAKSFADLLAAGLLQLFDVASRSQTVITCIYESWKEMERGLKSATHRFHTPPSVLEGMSGAEAIGELISGRLGPAYSAVGLKPDYPTWPFTPAAVASAKGMMPRSILMQCDAFRRHCLKEGRVELCHNISPESPAPVVDSTSTTTGIDKEFVQARRIATIDGLLDTKDEDDLGRLLRDIFDLYARQITPRETIDIESKGDPAQKMPPLHGRLTFTHHDENDREQHFCFRAIKHENAIAFQARLRAALTASGISNNISDRHLLIVRRGPIPGGAKTKQLFDAFLKADGKVIDPSDDDLKTFVALRMMQDAAVAKNDLAAFEAWLRKREPLCDTGFFKDAGLSPPPGIPPLSLSGASEGVPAQAPIMSGEFFSIDENGKKVDAHLHEENDEQRACGAAHAIDRAMQQGHSYDDAVYLYGQPDHSVLMRLRHELPSASETSATPRKSSPAESGKPSAPPSPAAMASSPVIPVGHSMTAGKEPVELPTAVLPRHIAIIAGAGSGKTVLLRRIVEEAALAGIPAIVIDPNNDLSRLGESWPERPSTFTSEDDAKAKRYKEKVEVVIWTPGIHAGKPLFLSVLPDFAALGDDRDEREQAVGMAAETLGPLAGAKTNLARGVLADALRFFASKGGGNLKDMTTLLAELPDAVSEIGRADQLAAKMADELKAAVATNPLLKATGPVLDPKLLFQSPHADKTRISVINLLGLASAAAKEDFVNRLQMTLFGWIKKHPSPKGMLYVIDEAQIFMPSGQAAISKTSGVQLVAQARKYGLGMIVATQAPKGIDNKVVSNCTTQFLGKQNANITQQAAKELIAASGGRADDIGKLKTGEFYFKTEASGKPVKIGTPICLTYHPSNPPTPEEVIEKAKASSP